MYQSVCVDISVVWFGKKGKRIWRGRKAFIDWLWWFAHIDRLWWFLLVLLFILSIYILINPHERFSESVLLDLMSIKKSDFGFFPMLCVDILWAACSCQLWELGGGILGSGIIVVVYGLSKDSKLRRLRRCTNEIICGFSSRQMTNAKNCNQKDQL